MRIIPPKIDDRTFDQILQAMQSVAPYYIPEWNIEAEKTSGTALLKLFVHMLEAVITRLNKVPDKNFIDFLNLMGMKLLPARSAQVPVTFQLVEGTTEDVLIPAATQISAPATDTRDEIIFETEQNLLGTSAKLVQVFSTNPSIDEVYYHTIDYENNTAFQVFSNDSLQEHFLYLGHNEILNVKSDVIFELEIELLTKETENGIQHGNIEWQYWSGEKWITMTLVSDDTVEGDYTFKKNGSIIIQKECSGEIVENEINTIKSRWIRGRHSNPITSVLNGHLPRVDRITIKTQAQTIAPDLAFSSDIPQNLITFNIQQVETTLRPIDIGPPLQLAVAIDHTDSDADLKKATFVDASKLKEGDLLHFHYGPEDNDFEEREIKSINNNEVTLTEALENSYSTDPNIVRLYTAIRKDESNPWIYVETVEGFVEHSIVIISHQSDLIEEAPISEIDSSKRKLRLDTSGFSEMYVEGDKVVVKEDKAITIYPFSTQPRLFSAFYIGSQEAFSKRGAMIKVTFRTFRANYENKPQLSWEYWNGNGWQLLQLTTDLTDNFLKYKPDARIEFRSPLDFEQTKVNGQENFWIRVRLIAGDYGTITYDSAHDTVINTILPPIITWIEITYDPSLQPLDYCLTFNNLIYEDVTLRNKFEGQPYLPFEPLDHELEMLHLGFDRPLISGPIKIYFSLIEQLIPEETKPRIKWTYWNGAQWTSLNNIDDTDNFTRSDTVIINGPKDFKQINQFGHTHYWIRASLVEGNYESELIINGIYPNTTWAIQATRIDEEILGSGSAIPGQQYRFLHFPIMTQEIWIKEPDLPSETEQKQIKKNEGNDAIQVIKDEDGTVTEIWIRWHEVPDFYNSSPHSRHYSMDQAIGTLVFGDGDQGKIPPIGVNNIKAKYQFVLGTQGNVAAREITSLKSTIPFVKSVINNEPAAGGSDTETIEQVLKRGPQVFKHRNRAVAEEDYEWLTRESSQYVARVKTLPNINNLGLFAPGWITIIIIPNSNESKPYPSPQLINPVKRYLVQRSVSTVIAAKHLHITGPVYVEIKVKAEIVPISIDIIATVNNTVINELNNYFHPLFGGDNGTGWEFGRAVCISDVYAFIENIDGVDYVKSLGLYKDGKAGGNQIEIDSNSVVCSGEHDLQVILEDA